MQGTRAIRLETATLRADLRDAAALVPDCGNKVNIAIKCITQTFWFLGAHKSYVYTILSLLCAIALFIKKPMYIP